MNEPSESQVMALLIIAKADERALQLSKEMGRRVRIACYPLYADEARTMPETQHTYEFKRFQFNVDDDVRGRFAGLLFFGSGDATTVRKCRMGEVDAWSVPLSAGLFEALDWAGDAYPSPPIDPSMPITLDVFGPFVCVAFLVLKADEPSN